VASGNDEKEATGNRRFIAYVISNVITYALYRLEIVTILIKNSCK